MNQVENSTPLTLEYLISIGFLRFRLMGGESNIRLLKPDKDDYEIVFHLRMTDDKFFMISGFINKEIKTVEKLNDWLCVLEIDLNDF